MRLLISVPEWQSRGNGPAGLERAPAALLDHDADEEGAVHPFEVRRCVSANRLPQGPVRTSWVSFAGLVVNAWWA